MFKGTLEPQWLYIFNPRLLQNPKHNKLFLNQCPINLSLKIAWQIISFYFFTERKSTLRALEVNIEKNLNAVSSM